MLRINRKIIIAMFIIGLLYFAMYITSLYILDVTYTLESTANFALLPAAIISIIPILWGKIYFSITTLVGYVSGVVLGELLGKSHTQPGHHYGFVICVAVYVVAVILGVIIEKNNLFPQSIKN